MLAEAKFEDGKNDKIYFGLRPGKRERGTADNFISRTFEMAIWRHWTIVVDRGRCLSGNCDANFLDAAVRRVESFTHIICVPIGPKNDRFPNRSVICSAGRFLCLQSTCRYGANSSCEDCQC